jgi:WD40 repeat protein
MRIEPTSDQNVSQQPSVDPTKTREVKVLRDERPLLGCRFDPTGRFIFAGGEANWVNRWELFRDIPCKLQAHDSWVRAIAFHPPENCVFTGGYDGRVFCWPCNSDRPEPSWDFLAHNGWVRSVIVSPDRTLLATTGNDNLVKLWSIKDRKLVHVLSGHGSHVYNAAFHPDGRHLASTDLHGIVKHWEVHSGKHLRDLDAGSLYKYDGGFRADIGGARGMTFSPDGRFVACSGITNVTNAFAGVGNPQVILFDWFTGQRKELFKPEKDFRGVAWGITFHPAGFMIGAGGGGSGGAIWFWNVTQPIPFFTFKLPSPARDLDLHPNGLQIATALYDRTLRVYDLSAEPSASA